MKKKSLIRTVSYLAALAFILTACGDKSGGKTEDQSKELSESVQASQDGKIATEESGEKAETPKEASEEYVPQKDQVNAEAYTLTIRSGKREKGTQGDVIVVYNPAQEEKVMTSVEGPKLVSGDEGDFSLTLADDFKGTISLGAGLKELRIVGGITLDLDRGETDSFTVMFDGESVGTVKAKAKEMVVSLAGEHDLRLVGLCDDLHVEANGNSRMDLKDFKAKDVVVDSNGDSHLVINAEKKLQVNADGKTLVEYVGEPKIEKNLSGDAKVNPAK